MKKYLGSIMTAYAAVIAPLFIVLPLLFAVIILCTTDIGGASVFLSCMLCGYSVVWIIYIKRIMLQLYAWGNFSENCVKIRCPFFKEYVIDYEKCLAVGIGCYVHGILNSCSGSKLYFIYLSYDYFDTKYAEKINLWKPNFRRIKVRFDNKLYTYLLSNLPKKQAKMLEQSYRNSSLGQSNSNKNNNH